MSPEGECEMSAVKKADLDGECERETLASTSLSPLRCPRDPDCPSGAGQRPADQTGCTGQLESVRCYLEF